MKRALVLPVYLGLLATGLREFFRRRSRSHGRNSARVVCVAQTPPPPEPCTNPVLLILSAANGHWFAAGIPKNDTDDQ
jgi:hypothetical protein